MMMSEDIVSELTSSTTRELKLHEDRIKKLEIQSMELNKSRKYHDDILQGHSSFINKLQEKQLKRIQRRDLCLTIFLCGLLLLWFVVGLYGIPVLFNQIFR